MSPLCLKFFNSKPLFFNVSYRALHGPAFLSASLYPIQPLAVWVPATVGPLQFFLQCFLPYNIFWLRTYHMPDEVPDA